VIGTPHLASWDSLLRFFAAPLTVYNEIYSPQNKWDKDYNLYRAFDADEAFFTPREYLKLKHRRALISNMFSRKAISEIQHLIRAQVRSRFNLRFSVP
jgi:hypothetical protein